MTKLTAERAQTEADWPPDEGASISFQSSDGLETGTLHHIRWGLVWRDFVLDDGRVIPERKIVGCPEHTLWRKPSEVTQEERERCEERLVSMAGAGLDPRSREQPFWAELNQYLAYTYLRFQPADVSIPGEGPSIDQDLNVRKSGA